MTPPAVRAIPVVIAVGEPVRTLANAITLVRTVAAMAVAIVAVINGSLQLLALGYAIYWIGDMADGMAARWRGEETRHGAVFDILGDRACTSLLAVGYVIHVPSAAAPMTIFLVQFMVLDALLSLSFLHFPLLGPNYFAAVDQTVYRLNWSPPAKAINTAAVVLLSAVGLTGAATVVALAVTALKIWSLRRVVALIGARPAPQASVD